MWNKPEPFTILRTMALLVLKSLLQYNLPQFSITARFDSWKAKGIFQWRERHSPLPDGCWFEDKELRIKYWCFFVI
jgi:hypothetical protein